MDGKSMSPKVHYHQPQGSKKESKDYSRGLSIMAKTDHSYCLLGCRKNASKKRNSESSHFGIKMIKHHFWYCSKFSILILFCISGLIIYVYKTDTFGDYIKYFSEDSQEYIYNSSFHHLFKPPYPYPYTFLINQSHKCLNRNPFLVLLVVGKMNDMATRNVIRETWGNESNYNNVDVIRIFLVGVSPMRPDIFQGLLEKESEIYKDIVQQDFQDTYNNLTLKTLMGMEWLTKFCSNARYAMKIDSDMFLNAEYLIHHLLHPELPVRKNYFSGLIVANTVPYRRKSSKWYIPKAIYPNNTYPPYCSGPGYVFSVDMARKIYKMAQVIQVIHLEDSFMGICLDKLNIPPTTPPKGIFNGHRIDYNRCAFNKLVTVHHYERDELRKIWPDFWSKRTVECKKWEGEI
ncbi:beta-1,3-galactosyltransferase 2-like [Bombina bombina]|uniref:beta-1,3-galactosyltransferase 2-like n=1 Tax=Bombina bombina TaxID=8345 RepID=UPI00235ACD10|nr:beta-1,3-galactosyltransferase 2-like [Bombina bombina]